MRLSDFDYHLPPELIAEKPANPRDSARLLHVSDGISDLYVTDLPDLLNAGDLIVFNNSKVIPARLYGHREGFTGKIEILLHKNLRGGVWEAWAKPARSLKTGTVMIFADDFRAVVLNKTDEGFVHLDFQLPQTELFIKLHEHGLPPLPPYIRREAEKDDTETYQTVYAKTEGSVAAPTAGLHFTDDLLQRIVAKGVSTAFVTLHVGAGTFKPVTVDHIHDHVMHYEWGEVDAATAKAVNNTKARGGRVISVGTTATRLLETATGEDGVTNEYRGDTNLFITPGYTFRCIDAMLTNFHLPKSTLFMLVSALMGLDRMQSAYAHAVERKYRFFSYGDACFLSPKTSSNSAA